MAKGAVLLLLSALFASTEGFHGNSISLLTPEKKADGTFQVTYYQRENGRGECEDQSSYTCEGGVCTTLAESASQTDHDNTGQERWCQSEGQTTAIISTNETHFRLSDSGCCWASNIQELTEWTSGATLNLGTRSDTENLNNCPVTATLSSHRVVQNCFTELQLLAYDPDGDVVTCRFATDTSDSNLTLNQTTCTLTASGEVDVGVHVLEVMVEDHPAKDIILTYADGTTESKSGSDLSENQLCSLVLQFTLEVLPPLPSCEIGHVLPMFLPNTPPHEDILHATVGEKFKLQIQAQAHHASINDFQISGPQNMTKELKDNEHGVVEVTLFWTPQPADTHRFTPLCFAAETTESQSEMRCVVVLVNKAPVNEGKVTVTCAPNKMTVALEKASIPDMNENFLQLLDPSCQLTFNGTHVLASMSFSTCGTKVEESGDFIVFTNKIQSFDDPDTIIIRRKTVNIDFSCQFSKTISISSYYNLQQSNYIFTESSFGSFGYSFDIYRDGNFTNMVEPTDYPVQVKLMDMIYMRIKGESDLPNVELFVESCKGTPDGNPENNIYYDLIKNGCHKDETLQVIQKEGMTYKFEMQSFKFIGDYDEFYITCSVILCEPNNPFSRCSQGCVKDAFRRRKRSLGMETSGHLITQGPLQFVGTSGPNTDMDNDNVIQLFHAEMKDDGEVEEKSVVVGNNDEEPLNYSYDDYVLTQEEAGAVDEYYEQYEYDYTEDDEMEFNMNTRSSEGDWEILNFGSKTVSWIIVLTLVVVALFVVTIYCTKQRKADDRKHLLSSHWEY